MALQVRRHDRVRSAGEASNRGREPAFASFGGAIRPRSRVVEGRPGKKVVTTSVRRDVVKWFKSRGMSERRACALTGLARSTCRYERRRSDPAELTTRLR